MARKVSLARPWPYGQPTTVCGTCTGTGMSQHAALSVSLSRRHEATATKDIRCGTCAGRGRVIVEEGSRR